VKAVQKGGRRSVVARKFGVSQSAVARIGQEAGIVRRPLSTGQKKSQRMATEAVKLEARRRRAEMSLALIDDAEKLRRQLFEPSMAFDFGGKDFAYVEHQLKQPDARSQQSIAIAMAVCLDKSLALERFDFEASNAVKAAIIQLVDRLVDDEDRATRIHVVDS
jgi:hypothetical protein